MTAVVERRTASRRQFLADIALLAGGGTLLAAATAAGPAAAKVGPGDVGYQPTPNGKQRCDGCTQWQSPNACKVVSGKISPSGWCSIYAQKH